MEVRPQIASEINWRKAHPAPTRPIEIKLLKDLPCKTINGAAAVVTVNTLIVNFVFTLQGVKFNIVNEFPQSQYVCAASAFANATIKRVTRV